MLKRLAIIACLPLSGCITIDLNILSMEEIEALPMPDVDMRVQESGVDASLRGVYALSETQCWASGSNGTCLRTIDGETWQRLSVPNSEDLDFRDVHPFDEHNALLMTAGTPARIYRTSDGGAHWTIVHEDHREGAFFDGMDFWDDNRGVLFGDPIDGVFTILLTDDGGRSWTHADPAKIPAALEGEAGFAASGTCVAAGPDGQAIIGLGGKTGLANARLLESNDFGRCWIARQSGLPTSESMGVFSVAFFDGNEVVIVGGDYTEPVLSPDSPEIQHYFWDAFQPRYTRLGNDYTYLRQFPGPFMPYRSAVAAGTLDGQHILLASGYMLTFVSSDLADYFWKPLDLIPGTLVHGEEHWVPWYQHAASFAPGTARAWIVGAEGKITRIDLSVPEK